MDSALIGDLPVLAIGVAAWMGVVALLFFLTRVWSRALAWTFLVVGVGAPVAFTLGWQMTTGLTCAERVIASGLSDDERFKFRITETVCRGEAAVYQIELGRNRDLAVMRTAFRSLGQPRPNDVKQMGPAAFRVFMSGPAEEAPDPPVMLELDPQSGRPLQVVRFVDGTPVPPADTTRSFFGREW